MEPNIINIGGENFSFKSENEDLLQISAELFNKQLEKLREVYGAHTDYKRILILAALNEIVFQQEKLQAAEDKATALQQELDEIKSALSVILEK
jgi:cell division protein ZapA (FtsZ GTPase activity inhibitor)